MAYQQPNLPYDRNALEPHISGQTLDFHYGKHHAAYVTKYNGFVKDTEYDSMMMEDVIKATAGDASKAAIFNNGAQAWNHSFYWNCMSPNGGGAPSGKIAELIDRDCGGMDGFKDAFKNAAAAQFGSGWAWLVLDNGKLDVLKTLNAANPMTEGKTPLLTIDVWEHAYYLDFQNRRPDYIDTFLDKLVNWEFVEENLNAAL